MLLFFFFFYDLWFLSFSVLTPIVSAIYRCFIVRMKILIEGLFQNDVFIELVPFFFITFLCSILRVEELIFFLHFMIILSFLVLIFSLFRFICFQLLNIKISSLSSFLTKAFFLGFFFLILFLLYKAPILIATRIA